MMEDARGQSPVVPPLILCEPTGYLHSAGLYRRSKSLPRRVGRGRKVEKNTVNEKGMPNMDKRLLEALASMQ